MSGGPPRKRFHLTGPSVPLDPRTNAVRRDLADIAVADRVFAQHYAVPLLRVAAHETPVLLTPRSDADVVGSLDAGDGFEVLDIGSEWAWGRCSGPGCVGYVAVAALVLS